MFAEHPCHPFHRFKSAAHGSFSPVVQKSSGPSDRFVVPEVIEAIFELPRPPRRHLACQNPINLDPGLATNPTPLAQEAPAHFLELGCQRLTPQPRALGSADLIIALRALAKEAPNIAYLLKESFGQLWGYQSEAWARRFFENWKQSLKWQRLKPYEKFARMIDRHWDGIAAYCHPRNKVPLGFVEGFNNKIRVLQRRAYGLRDEEYLRLKILTCMLPAI